MPVCAVGSLFKGPVVRLPLTSRVNDDVQAASGLSSWNSRMDDFEQCVRRAALEVVNADGRKTRCASW